VSFANPIALWALAGLLVPLLIHLFSHDRGRRLPFAAVRFIPGFKSQQLRSPRLSQWLLFLLRCLLLTLIAVMLARPVLRDEGRLGGDVAVLVSPLALLSGAETTRSLARQIAASNATEARLLAADFPILSDQSVGDVHGAWSLLAELQNRIEPETRLLVLIADDPRETLASKPRFQHEVEWLVVSGAADQSSESLRVGLVANAERQVDLEFLGAALETLQASGLEVAIKVFDLATSAGGQDVLFVLSDEACPEPGQGQLIICDMTETGLSSDQTLQTIVDYDGLPFDLQLGSQPEQGGEPVGEPVLRARSGHVVAVLVRSGNGSQLLWNSRFNPQQAAIVASRYFPDLLSDLIWQNRLAGVIPTQSVDDEKQRAEYGVEVWLPALLVLLLWLFERWLSTRRPTSGRDDTLAV
jgi:hypothetical protein